LLLQVLQMRRSIAKRRLLLVGRSLRLLLRRLMLLLRLLLVLLQKLLHALLLQELLLLRSRRCRCICIGCSQHECSRGVVGCRSSRLLLLRLHRRGLRRRRHYRRLRDGSCRCCSCSAAAAARLRPVRHHGRGRRRLRLLLLHCRSHSGREPVVRGAILLYRLLSPSLLLLVALFYDDQPAVVDAIGGSAHRIQRDLLLHLHNVQGVLGGRGVCSSSCSSIATCSRCSSRVACCSCSC
ncbi:hypothetical protein PFISCL1PPCAC_8814, partial [Pristionchus fissidentatus]